MFFVDICARKSIKEKPHSAEKLVKKISLTFVVKADGSEDAPFYSIQEALQQVIASSPADE